MKYLSMLFVTFLLAFCDNKSKSTLENTNLVYQDTIKFDILQHNDTLSKKIPISNNTDKIIEIYEMISDCGCIQSQIEGSFKIQPNDSVYLHIKYLPKEAGDEGFVDKTISFRTNNEDKPLNNITLLGYVER